MRLLKPNSLDSALVIEGADIEKTFGQLKYSAFRGAQFEYDDDNNPTEVIRKRTYDLKCKEQGCMIQVGLPPEVAEKNFPYDAEVELVNPVVGATVNTDGRTADWYINADDIILKRTGAPSGNMQSNQPPRRENQGDKKE